MPDADASRKRQISGRRIPGWESSLLSECLASECSKSEAETSGRAFRLAARSTRFGVRRSRHRVICENVNRSNAVDAARDALGR